MLITTVETLQGMQIAAYKGIVACRVMDLKSLKHGVPNTMALVFDDLKKQAISCGANAVIGVRVIPESTTIFFATGTAVLLE